MFPRDFLGGHGTKQKQTIALHHDVHPAKINAAISEYSCLNSCLNKMQTDSPPCFVMG